MNGARKAVRYRAAWLKHRKSGFYVGEKLALACGGYGAVCRALQGSAALLSVHRHHRYRLRILRNHAGPPPRPVSCSIPIWWGSPCVTVLDHPYPPFFRLKGPLHRPPLPRPATETEVSRDGLIQTPNTYPSFSCHHPLRDKVPLLLTSTFPQVAEHKAEVAIQNKNKNTCLTKCITVEHLYYLQKEIFHSEVNQSIHEPGFYQVNNSYSRYYRTRFCWPS